MLATQPRTYYSFEFPFLLEADSIPLTVKHVSVIRRVFFKTPVRVLYLYFFIFLKSFHTWSTDSYWKKKNETDI